MINPEFITTAVTVLAVLAGALHNNARVHDMAGRFSDLSRHTTEVAAATRTEMRMGFEGMNRKLHVVLALLANIDRNAAKLESCDRKDKP